MDVRLVVEKPGRRKEFPLPSMVSVIGRGRGNALRIPSADVSRKHCRLIQRDGLVMVEDLDSVNGTFLNGRRVKRTEVVHPGDQIDVGPVRFTIEYDLSQQAWDRLHGGEDDLLVLDELTDGEVIDDIAVLEEGESTTDFRGNDELEPLELELVDDLEEESPPPKKTGKKQPPAPPRKPAPKSPNEDLELLPPNFTFNNVPWDMPEGEDLRDLLSQMEDDETHLSRNKKKKPRGSKPTDDD
ncbi:MAG: FHA domain-containing protein [Gemmataceae bacterium]